MKKIQYNGSSKILNGIVTKVNLIIDKLVVDVKVNGTSVVVVNEEGEREADIDLSLADQNVKQSPTTSSDNSDYRVLLSKSANDTEETDISRKDTNFKYNPSTGNLQTTKLNGNTVPSGSGNDTLAKTSDIPDMTNYIQKSLTVGLIKNDGTIDQTQYATMSDIPDELADLADDSTHRLVTDTEKNTWNNNRAVSEILLTNEDLNNVTTVGFYYAAGGNTVTNKPSGYGNFGLVVIHNASGSQYTQIISNENGSHRRIKKSDGTWTNWVEEKYTDTTYTASGVVSIDANNNITSTAEVNPTVATGSVFGSLAFDNVNKFIDLKADSQSSGQDLNNYTTEGFYFFSGVNTPTNVPSGINGFLLVIKSSSNVVKQFWIRQGSENTQSDTLVRLLTSSGWTTWRRYATTDDLPTVNDNTISITQNGTAVDSFTLNQNSNKTIDVKDEKVKQTSLTYLDDNNYRILLSKSASDSEETDGVNKYGDLLYNPAESKLTTSNVEFASANIHSIITVELITSQYYFQDGHSQVVAMLEANSASQSSNPTMLYLPSTTGTLATLADIPTVVDEKVKQTPENNSSSEFEVLLSGTADNTEHTEGAKKSSKLKFVPWNSCLEVGTLSSGFYDGTVEAGSIHGYGVSGIQLDAGNLSNKGTLSIYNNAGKSANIKFSNSATSDKYFDFPTVGGTIATLNDIPTITDTYDGTSSEGMSGIAVKSAIDALDVASTSIAAGETLATIKEDNGKIAVTKQNISIKNNQIENYCMVGTASAISSGVTWHKVASTTLTITNDDAIIMFAVQDAYLPDTDSASDSNGGILYCRVRQGNPVGTHNYGKLKFVANSGLDVSNFRLYYTIASGTSITYEIWTSMNRRYAFRKFVVLSQSNRYQAATEKWTLYNSTSPTSAPTESDTCVRIECEDNTYKQTDNNILGGKNLIRFPYPNGTPNITANNVTINVDNDGVLTITGSNPSSNFGYGISGKTQKTVIVLDPAQSYIMSGMSGGSGSTVRFLLDLWTASQNPETDSYTTRLYQATTETIIPTGYKYLQITLYFYTSAASLFPLTVKPMLRLASIADNTFVPYSDTNKFLSSDKIGRREQEFYGSKNLLPYPWNETTVEKNGITFTDNGDGSVTANGTASANTTFYFIVRNNARWRLEVPKGMYKLTGCPSGGSDSTYSLYFNAYRKGTSTAQSGLRDNGNGGYINYSYDAWCGGYIDIKSGTRCDNLVFKPMLRPFYSTDDEYADYAQTNRQLTISKADYRDIATIETTGKASKAYAKNELMIWRGDLHRVTQAITSGGSITLNTNVVATTLSAEIKAIRDALNI